MSKRKGKKKSRKKKSTNWRDLAIHAIVDLITGTVLVLIEKLIK